MVRPGPRLTAGLTAVASASVPQDPYCDVMDRPQWPATPVLYTILANDDPGIEMFFQFSC
jgi:hypothetical protein